MIKGIASLECHQQMTFKGINPESEYEERKNVYNIIFKKRNKEKCLFLDRSKEESRGNMKENNLVHGC